jgi:hypothetical protein
LLLVTGLLALLVVGMLLALKFQGGTEGKVSPGSSVEGAEDGAASTGDTGAESEDGASSDQSGVGPRSGTGTWMDISPELQVPIPSEVPSDDLGTPGSSRGQGGGVEPEDGASVSPTLTDEERSRRRRDAIERRQARQDRAAASRSERDAGGPVSLSISHSPVRSARIGSSELVTVRMDAPRSAKVVLHSGPSGGPYRRTRLKAKSGGRWEGWIDFRGTSVGEDFHYWLVATHPRASAPARSGSSSAPHRVSIQ